MTSPSISISSTVLSRVFFGGGGTSLLTTLGGFAVAYLMRPLGAVFFGHIGDRLGRRHMLLLSVALMTAAMLATALLAHLCADRRGRRLAAVPAALRHGILGRRRIYRRGCLFAGRRAGASARPGCVLGVGGQRGGRTARGRRFGPDRRLDGRGQPAKLGLANSLPGWRRARGSGLDRAVEGWKNRPNSIGRKRPEQSRTIRSAIVLATTVPRLAGPSPSRRWDRSPIMSASPMFPPS